MQQFDQAPIMKNLHDGIAIVIDGNKAKVAADEGQYILLKNSTITGKEDGGYIAAKDIPADTVLDDTYLSSKLSEGIANSLNDQIPKVNGSSVSLIIKTGGPIGISSGIDPSTNNVTFSTPFPNALLHVSATCNQAHFGSPSTISVWNESVSGFKLSQKNTVDASMQIIWMAIGY